MQMPYDFMHFEKKKVNLYRINNKIILQICGLYMYVRLYDVNC